MVTVQLQHWIQRGSQVIQAIQARAVDCGEAGSSYHGIYSCCELRLSFYASLLVLVRHGALFPSAPFCWVPTADPWNVT
jgi:hypothetical protein